MIYNVFESVIGHFPFQYKAMFEGISTVRYFEKENIILEQGETLPLTVQYISNEKTEGYVLRIKQFVQDGATSVLVGGQTFVDGKVKGFPVEIIDEKTDETKNKYPSWLWILIILLIILIVGLLIAQYF